MDHHSISSPNWYKALTLAERIALFTEKGRLHLPLGTLTSNGQNQLQQWHAQPQFETGEILDQRLALDNLDQDQLAQLLALPLESIARQSDSLDWVQHLHEAYSQPATAYVNPPSGAEELCFLDLIQPLIDHACEQLFVGVEAIITRAADLPFEPQEIEDILLMNLPGPLLIRLGRTMVLELNVARLQGQLAGDVSSDRFQSFVDFIRRPEQAIAILSDYPVLAQQLVLCLNQWVEVSLEFIERLCRDWQEIRHSFCHGEDPGRLVDVAGGAGDTHRNGRSVMIAEFESGFHLVYKPKSLAIDHHFQQLLNWFNTKGCDPPFRTLNLLDRGEYGWVEYIAHEACTNKGEIHRYYRRLGSYLCLLYAINASDFHLENLIACGEHPILIDLETLFNPEFEAFEEPDAASSAAKTMLSSVLVVGMLPQRLWSQEEYTGIDISGLGGETGQLSPDRVPQPDAPGTDEMRYVRQRLEMSGEANRPILDDVEASAIDHIPDILTGFNDMYELLLDHRQELLQPDGPLSTFSDDETRVLLRPTRTYDQLLFESFHPDVLADALPRDLLLDRLWVVVPERPFMIKAIAAEQHDLHQADIPVFTTTPTSRTLWSASGEPIQDLLLLDGMTIARQRIKNLNHEDLRRQSWFIRSSLATLSTYEFGLTNINNARVKPSFPSGNISRQRLLDGARSVALDLQHTAVHGQDDVTWISLEHLDDGIWDLAPIGADLYNGLAGITFFLAYAGSILQDDACTTLAQKSVSGLLRHIDSFNTDLSEIGACTGWGGLLFTLTHLSALWDDSELKSHAAGLISTISDFVDQDENYSFSDGAAGAIASLLSYHQLFTSASALETAVACGNHLLASAHVLNTGLGWINPRYGPQPLLGYAHGTAGIAAALLRLSKASGLNRFRVAARQAITHERSFFSSTNCNWPDLRQVPYNEEPQRYPIAWCHGAAGIGLARLQSIGLLDDASLPGEIHSALQTTAGHGFGQNHSLCHGDMGSLELLLVANQTLPDQARRLAVDRFTNIVLDGIDRDGLKCGGPLTVEMPGLMLGTAGIGYQMLRLASPDAVPSILLFDPPPT